MGVRTELERLFGEIPEAEWQALEREGYVDAYEVALDETERQEALTLAIQFLKRRGIRPRKAVRTQGSAYSLDGVSGAIVALQAAELNRVLNAPVGTLTETERALRDTVNGFRRQYLPEGLIPPESIPEWLRAQSGAVVSETALILHPEVAGEVIAKIQRREPVQLTPEQVQSIQQACETLAYGGRVYPVREGALQHLKACVEAVRAFTQWAEGDCIAYVLSGAVPEGLPIDWSIRTTYPANLSFIQVRVPAFFRPETVGRLYAQVRRGVARGSRLRGLQESHIALIRFVEQYRLQHPKARWSAITEAWNAECEKQGRPEWRMRVETVARHYNGYVRTLLNLATAVQE